jgi:hypothetical protein
VVAIYRGFEREGHASAGYARASQSRQTASGAKPLYSREQIKRLYEQHRLGQISDARWAQIEPDIFAASREGRVVGALIRPMAPRCRGSDEQKGQSTQGARPRRPSARVTEIAIKSKPIKIPMRAREAISRRTEARK